MNRFVFNDTTSPIERKTNYAQFRRRKLECKLIKRCADRLCNIKKKQIIPENTKGYISQERNFIHCQIYHLTLNKISLLVTFQMENRYLT